MDTKTLIKSLRAFFINENKVEKKYTKVWINRIIHEIPVLGYYNSKRFEVNIQYDNPIPREYLEVRQIIKLLHEKIEGILKRIDGVNVYYFEDGYYHCHGDDILVYDDESDK